MSDRTAHESEQAAAYLSGRCRRLLRERVGDGAPITVETLVHDDGGFKVKAFHTHGHASDGDGFYREIVEYDSRENDGPRERYTHAVEYYHTGHHEVHYEFQLDTITD